MNRCHFCLTSSFITEFKPGWWCCVDVIDCDYRARLRIGMNKWQALKLLKHEQETSHVYA